MPISSPAAWRTARETFGLERRKCRSCGTVAGVDFERCPRCGEVEDREQIQLSRRGTVMTYVVQHYLPEGFRTPLVLAVVETVEGGKVFGPVDCPPGDVAIGMPVAVTTRARDGSDGDVPTYGITFVPRAPSDDDAERRSGDRD